MAIDSTYNRGNWHTENGLIVPREDTPVTTSATVTVKPKSAQTPKIQKTKSPVFTKEAIGVWKLPETTGNIDEIPVDSVAVTADSIVSKMPVKKGMVLQSEIVADSAPVAPTGATDIMGEGMSWVFLALGLLFCAIALKFKSNTKYLRALLSDLTEVRDRPNAFDDTVRETSFLFLLNVMWVCCAGILLWKFLSLQQSLHPEWSMGIGSNPGLNIACCTAATAVYAVCMSIAYWMVGNVFTDRVKTRLWVKGWAASQGLEVVLLFPLALLVLCYAPWAIYLLEIAAGVFIIGKIIFIYKGFRIFFNQISSWLLFLYYLCSLEIVPLILTYIAASWMCSTLK